MRILILFLAVLCPFFIFSQNQNLPIDVELRSQLASPGHFGHAAAKLENVIVKEINETENIIILKLEMPQTDILSFSEHDYEDFYLPMQHAVTEMGHEDLTIWVREVGSQQDYVQLLDYITEDSADTPVYTQPDNTETHQAIKGNTANLLTLKSGSTHIGQAQPNGALSGKTVWLSPGHGYMYYTSIAGYTTQRGNTNDMVEDFGSVETVGYYLLKYLWNAGANVWMVRERDFNTNEVIVDNDDGAPGYTETGTWGTSGSSGWDGGGYRFANSTTGAESASATFTPNIPEAGWYWVSVFFREGANRSVDTRYIVNHAGGSTTVSVNQEVHGRTWNYVGQFYFDAGMSGNVVLSNTTTDGSGVQAIIADAVRFGGGMGTEQDCDIANPGVSGQPRFEEAAQMYAPYMGYPTCNSDVTIRPKYAEWELSKGTASEQNNPTTDTYNSMYFSWHSNAVNSAVRGTETYMYHTSTVYNDSAPPASTPCADGEASAYLRNFVHDNIVDDIQADWDPTWNDRNPRCANFGEIRELTTMPGILLEIAFHDNSDDAEAMTTPEFRKLSARGAYKGIVEFFNHYDTGVSTDFIPETPTHIVAKNNAGSNSITISWNPPPSGGVLGDPATGYKLYTSTHGKGFNDGIPVVGNSYTVNGLAPGTVYYFRVAATNDGGESFPSSVVAAKTPLSGTAVPILIVDGFDRLQRSQMVYENEGGALGNLYRGFLERMNAYTYMVEHAQSISSCTGVAFDGATNEGVIDGTSVLTDYDFVDWFVGEESTTDRTFNATEQNLIQTFLDGGGDIMVSGAEIGWDIGRSSSGNAALGFYNNYLKSVYAGDDGNSYNFSGSPAGPFAGVGGSFDDGDDIYDVNFPDRLAATAGGMVALNYSGGTGDGAAVIFDDPSGFGVVNFGFPLETVSNANVRDDLICNAMSYLNNTLLAAEGLELFGKVETKRNILEWQTLSEENTETFILERSKDGFDYESIHELPAAMNSTSLKKYGYTDEHPFAKTYYRVKLEDLDESVSYSNVIVLEQENTFAVSIYPNPSSRNQLSIRIDSEEEEVADFQLLDMSGRLIVQRKLESNEVTLDLPELATGTYHYIIARGNSIANGKWVKM